MPDIRHTIDDPKMKKILNEIGNTIGLSLLPNWGFNLLLFEFGGPDKSLFYISSAEREDVIQVMKEWIKRQEKQ